MLLEVGYLTSSIHLLLQAEPKQPKVCLASVYIQLENNPLFTLILTNQ